MRIVYLVNQYPRASHTFIRTEIELLEARGFQIERVTVNDAADELVDERDELERSRTRLALKHSYVTMLGYALLALAVRPLGFLRAIRRALRMARRSPAGWIQHLGYVAEACVLREHCRRLKIQHVHAHFGTNSAAIAYLTRLLGGPTYSFTVHGTETFDTPAFLALSEKIDQATFVAAVSLHGSALLQRWTPEELWPKIRLVRCVPDAMFYSEPPMAQPAAARLVCVARLSAEKGILTLIDAAALLRRQGLEFEIEIVGDGPLRLEALNRSNALDLQRHVIFSGWKSGDEVKHAILSARALVQPSYAEGLPVATMEALMLRRPVISTCVGGVPEIVRAGEAGWLVPAGSVSGLAAAMRAALEASPAELERRGLAGRERVLAVHAPEPHIQTLARALRGESEPSRGRDKERSVALDGALPACELAERRVRA